MEFVLYEAKDRIAAITLNRPEARNAQNKQMLDELDAAWRWIDPIREGWAQHDERIKSYVAGSWGPAASSALISRDGFAWQDET